MDEWKVAITCRKLTSQAKVQLVDKDIPTELAKILNHTNADSCKKSIDIVEKAFQTAVEKAVEEKYFKTSYVDIKPYENGNIKVLVNKFQNIIC